LEFELRHLLQDIEHHKSQEGASARALAQQREGVRQAIEATREEQTKLSEELMMLRSELMELETVQANLNAKKKLLGRGAFCMPSPRMTAQMSHSPESPPDTARSSSPTESTAVPDSGRASTVVPDSGRQNNAVPDSGRFSVEDGGSFVPINPPSSTIGQVGRKDRMCGVGGLFNRFGR